MQGTTLYLLPFNMRAFLLYLDNAPMSKAMLERTCPYHAWMGKVNEN